MRFLWVWLLLAAPAFAQTVRIATEASYAPFESRGPDGQLQGMDIDLGRAVCARAKLQCQYVNMDFDGMIAALQAHQVDAIISQMSVTPARAAVVGFSAPLTLAPAQFTAAKGSGITDDAATLKGKIVGVQSGTTHEAYVRKHLADVVDIKVYQGMDQAFQDLASGRIDAALSDRTVAYAWLKNGGKDCCELVGKPLDDPVIFGAGTAIAVRRDDAALRTAFDAAIAAIRADGTFAAINAKYFPFSIEPK